MRHRALRAHGRRADEHGFVLVTALLFLIVSTLLAISMYRNSGLDERVAGGTRDKERALEVAQAAMRWAEYWLVSSGGGTGGDCAGVTDGNDSTKMRICTAALTTPTQLPWSVRSDYLPPGLTVASGGGLASSGDVNYSAKAALHIRYVGLSADGLSQLYTITTCGWGANAETAVVLQSTFQLSSGVTDVGGL